jgi:hypothetical protein
MVVTGSPGSDKEHQNRSARKRARATLAGNGRITVVLGGQDGRKGNVCSERS